MDGAIKEFLKFTSIRQWLEDRNLDWLINDQIIGLFGIIIGSAIVYYIGWVLIRKGVQHLIRGTAKYRAWHRKDVEKREKTLLGLTRNIWTVVVLVYAGSMIASKIFGLDLSPLFASAGIIGVAIGFGSQSLIKDFLSGVFIIAENQYRVGDVVDIMGSAGTVEKVSTRSTVVRDIDGNVHYIPNGTIQLVINKTMGYSAARFTLDISADSDVSKAEKIIDEVGQKLAQEDEWKKKIIEAPKFVAITGITGQYTQVAISGKTMPSDQWSVTAEMRSRLLKAFKKAGISLATLPLPLTPPK